MPLPVKINKIEMWNSDTEEISYLPAITLMLEHSLISISKWESKWKKPFLGTEEKTNEQILDYIKAMTINKREVQDIYYDRLSIKDIKRIYEYIGDSMTATWFNQNNLPKNKNNGEIVTSELIYYWLVALEIPFEVEKWHLNRLLTLVQICNIKQQAPKKMSKRDINLSNSALNKMRKAKAGIKG